MLPRSQRIRSSALFRQCVRRGRRFHRGNVVLYLVVDGNSPGARAGFIVGRNVGPAVVRHRVARRLRHLISARLSEFGPGVLLVVRALPGAGELPGPVLARQVNGSLDGALTSTRATSVQASGTAGRTDERHGGVGTTGVR